ncbi:MAG: fibronectin type III domain-containing protein [Proteobacteria bacterium]|nr:fibronectin type III domain-containing protein [Pseudomonadota bacterium]
MAYVFRVAAVNSAGAGVYSAPSVPVTPYTTPGTPTSVVATSGQNGQVPISWSAPASNGSAITNYSYQYSSDGGVNWSTAALTGSSATSFTVAGLTNGTPYVFRVAGVNAAGTGSYGQTSSSVTPRAVPGAPTSVVATSGQNGQVPISWSAPASNGGNAHRWGLRLKITMQIGITPHGIR